MNLENSSHWCSDWGSNLGFIGHQTSLRWKFNQRASRCVRTGNEPDLIENEAEHDDLATNRKH